MTPSQLLRSRESGRRRLLALIVVGSTLVAGPVFAASRAKAVSAGSNHTCAVTTGGGVKCWGANHSGQLGDGTTTDRTMPTEVVGLASGVATIAAGSEHACAVSSGGGAKCWGSNSDGQLGDGTRTSRTTPLDVVGLTSGVATIAAGSEHTCAVTTGSGVKCWGDNSTGQLGDGTTTSQATPADVAGLMSGVAAVAAGGRHACALTTGGGVKCWGDNSYGQLGDGTTIERWVPTQVTGLTSGATAIAAVGFHTCAVTTGGGVKCWGQNSWGQLGDGTTTSRTIPTDVSGLTSGVGAMAAGRYHTCAVTTGSGVKCWGDNSTGQLGDGTTTQRTTPTDVSGLTSGVTAVAAGTSHTCAVTTGGGVRCWGDNRSGQLGDGTTAHRTTPTDVSGLTSGVAAVSAGSNHTCAVTTGGGVKCWGLNDDGQLGDGTITLRATSTDVTGLTSGVTAVAAGTSHTCAVTTGGGVKCWGRNSEGQLGDGTTTDRLTPTDVVGLAGGVATIAAGSYHACAVTTGGGGKCWGLNSQGQLGDGTTTDRLTPTDVTGLTSGVEAIAAGLFHTCAMTTSGGVKCWGRNSEGQLGDGTTTDRLTPTDVVGLTSGVATIAAVYLHTCALTAAGAVKCWGANYSGQLGDGTTTQRTTPTDVSGLTSGVGAIAAGGSSHTCAVTTNGGVKCWGGNIYGQLGDGTTTDRLTPTDVTGLTSGVAAVAAGDYHTCVLTTGGGVKCWGDNASGELGNPAFGPHLTPVRTRGFGQPDFDRDDVADVAVYRPSAGTWFSLDSSTKNSTYRLRGWGVQAQGDTPAPGDYDGDGVVDPTVFRPAYGTWFVLKSSGNYAQYAAYGWGTASDTLMPGDYDVDGATDIAVYRPSTGQWFVLPSSSNFSTGWGPITFGDPAQGDVPIAGDFDGDGKRDIAVYRPSTGTWFWLKSSLNYTQMDYRGWGVQAEGDVPAPGDYDGDGKTDPTVYRAQYGTWFVLKSSSNYTQYVAYGWGGSDYTPMPADYDGDGRTDVAVYRPTMGEWFVKPSDGASPWSVVFGQVGDVPLVVR